MAVHAGSWFGLPDFGITEAIGGLLGAPRTAQGGSNIIGTNVATPANPGSYSYNGLTPVVSYVNGGQNYPAVGTPGNPSKTGGSVQTSVPVNNNQPQQQQNDPYASIRNDISGAWDNYLNSLNDTTGYLNDQRTAQQGIADSQLQQGINTANDQKAKSLKDIANTTRNAFQAGNNYLGSLGAGDSSAANQYSFAINQQANKQTGDLNNFVSSQIQGLQAQHDQQIQQIASWFAQQQETLKQQIAQGQLSKGQDLANLSKNILDQAMQATNAIKANTQNQYNALLSWATTNSQNLGQLQQNIAAIPQAMGQMESFGGTSAPVTYGGAPTNQKTDIFGRPIV